jgi:hypothetical protein
MRPTITHWRAGRGRVSKTEYGKPRRCYQQPGAHMERNTLPMRSSDRPRSTVPTSSDSPKEGEADHRLSPNTCRLTPKKLAETTDSCRISAVQMGGGR